METDVFPPNVLSGMVSGVHGCFLSNCTKRLLSAAITALACFSAPLGTCSDRPGHCSPVFQQALKTDDGPGAQSQLTFRPPPPFPPPQTHRPKSYIVAGPQRLHYLPLWLTAFSPLGQGTGTPLRWAGSRDHQVSPFGSQPRTEASA